MPSKADPEFVDDVDDVDRTFRLPRNMPPDGAAIAPITPIYGSTL
jgi:hypothetical protein